MSDKSGVTVDDAELRQQQATEVKRARKQAVGGGLAVGQAHYIIESSWLKTWVAYSKAKPPNSSKPGAIDNNPIIDQSSPKNDLQLKPNLQEHADYDVVTELEWKLFVEWYGGGPPIKRSVISEGENKDFKRVEVYLMDLLLVPCKKDGSPDEDKSKKIFISKQGTLKELLTRSAAMFRWSPHSIRLWNFENPQKASIIGDLDRTLADEELVYSQTVLIEKQRKLGIWPRDSIAGKSAHSAVKKKPSFFARLLGRGGPVSRTSVDQQAVETKDLLPKGLCGLRNLGNTCFMNSALQCLSNTEGLRTFFLAGKYLLEINKNNPLGMKGQIAEQFGALITHMWSGLEASISPKSFKHTLGKFAPQFEGFNQHDCHELLSFVLDGLHEDLNRVQKKPYVEKKEANGRPDEIVAQEAWADHLRRNRSVIVDLFHGLLKSTVTCPDCGKISVTFDPYMNLSLPLLQEAERPVEVILMRQNERRTPYKYAVRVAKHGKVSEVRETLSSIVSIPAQQLILAFIEDHKVDYIYSDTDQTSKINPGELLIGFEIPNGDEYVHLRGMHRRRKKRAAVLGSQFDIFGLPFIFSFVPGTTTARQLYQYAWQRCERFICLPEPDEEDEAGGSEESSEPSKKADRLKRKSHKSKRLDLDSLPPFPFYVNSLPFRISLVTSTGSHCARCGNSCDGCYLDLSDDPVTLPKDTRVSFAIDWEDAVLENFYDDDEALSVRLHKSVSEARRDYSQKTTMTLDECFKLFTTTERLGVNDLWYCPQCKEHRRAWKKFDLWTLPEFLVVHLKRFQFTREFRTKLGFDVDFPIQGLNLDAYVINSDEKGAIYDLYAVANHMGGLGGGHYTAYCWNQESSSWFSFNDSMVTTVRNPDSMKTSAAYLLFYRRRPKGQTDPLTANVTNEQDDSESASLREGSNSIKPASSEDSTKDGQYRDQPADPPAISNTGSSSAKPKKARSKRKHESKSDDGLSTAPPNSSATAPSLRMVTN